MWGPDRQAETRHYADELQAGLETDVAPNKYGWRYDKAERRLDQVITAMPLRATLPPVITSKFHQLKCEGLERYLQQLERQLREYRVNPEEWADFTVRHLREEDGSNLGRKIHWPAAGLERVLRSSPISLLRCTMPCRNSR